jgi:hypothetical protein
MNSAPKISLYQPHQPIRPAGFTNSFTPALVSLPYDRRPAMLKIDLTTDLQQTIKSVHLLTESQIKWAMADALTASGQHAQQRLSSVIPKYVDRPTPRTSNSIYSSKATERRLSIAVGFKGSAILTQFGELKGFDNDKDGDPNYPGGYLLPMVRGGRRPRRRSERRLLALGLIPRAYPALMINDDPLPGEEDQYGNARAGWVKRVLSRAGHASGPGFNANRSGSARSRAKQRGEDYFYAPAGSVTWFDRPMYLRRTGKRPSQMGTRPYGKPDGKRPQLDLPRGIRPAMVLTREPNYRPTFPVSDILARAFAERYAQELPAQIERRLRRAGFR